MIESNIIHSVTIYADDHRSINDAFDIYDRWRRLNKIEFDYKDAFWIIQYIKIVLNTDTDLILSALKTNDKYSGRIFKPVSPLKESSVPVKSSIISCRMKDDENLLEDIEKYKEGNIVVVINSKKVDLNWIFQGVINYKSYEKLFKQSSNEKSMIRCLLDGVIYMLNLITIPSRIILITDLNLELPYSTKNSDLVAEIKRIVNEKNISLQCLDKQSPVIEQYCEEKQTKSNKNNI